MMFSSPPASFAYSASVNRPAASFVLRVLWMLTMRFTTPPNGPLLPAVSVRAAAILLSSSVAMFFVIWPAKGDGIVVVACDDPAPGAKHSRPTLTLYWDAV
jgi:hypothetical protein